MINTLYEKAIQGDLQAEADLYQTLFDRFVLIVKQRIREATQQECEDIAQDACKTVMEKYRRREPNSEFAAWAYQTLRHKIGNVYQQRRNTVTSVEADHALDKLADGSAPDPLFAMAVRDCFRTLVTRNRNYARILSLSHYGFSAGEICDRLGISTTNCYSILSRARKLMMECLEGKGIRL